MVHLYPTPDATGIAKTREYYMNQFGRTITDEEAYEILNSVMHFLFLINQPIISDSQCSDTPSTPENPMNAAR